MEFNEILNSYIEKVGCTNKGLSDLSGISAETIGRYRKGSRKPTRKSDTIQKLSEGLSKLSDNKLSEAEIYHTLYESLNDGINVEFNIYVSNLNKLTECMEISKSELAKEIQFRYIHVCIKTIICFWEDSGACRTDRMQCGYAEKRRNRRKKDI